MPLLISLSMPKPFSVSYVGPTQLPILCDPTWKQLSSVYKMYMYSTANVRDIYSGYLRDKVESEYNAARTEKYLVQCYAYLRYNFRGCTLL